MTSTAATSTIKRPLTNQMCLNIQLTKQMCDNMNKLSLAGMQPPEKYKENFKVSSESPRNSRRRAFTRNSPYTFQVVASLPNQ